MFKKYCKFVWLITACEGIPSVDNSNYENTTEEYIDGRMVEGFEVTYTCADNFRSEQTKSTCNREGKWLPTVECLPGKSIRLHLNMLFFIGLVSAKNFDF